MNGMRIESILFQLRIVVNQRAVTPQFGNENQITQPLRRLYVTNILRN